MLVGVLKLRIEKRARKYEIQEEDMTDFTIRSRYEVPGDASELEGARDLKHSFTLTFHRKKHYLILTYPSSAVTVWDTNTGGKSSL